jgi:glycosyltransferase involved in cell wall biosynthesis/2-polyprenyl-3-methyl-5-hydroxy-6-metoxy-1,4-benzoquinol methylase
VIRQTFTDWEMLVVNEFGSDDGTAEMVNFYAKYDKRIKLVQNTEKLGLGESLNVGIRAAKGEYIARLDSDDLSIKNRFEKQVKFLDGHKKVAVVGSWQRRFIKETWTHKPPASPEQVSANLLFWCDLCHSTLMLRTKTFIENNLFFDSNFLAEDYELWTRVVRVAGIANIQEVLGLYRVDGNNITTGKLAKLKIEQSQIFANNLKRNLGIDLPESEFELFRGWGNIYQDEKNIGKRNLLLARLRTVMTQIYDANKSHKFYSKRALLSILRRRWLWAKDDRDWRQPLGCSSFSKVFHNNDAGGTPFSIRTILLWLPMFFFHKLKNKLKKYVEQVKKYAEQRTWYLYEKATNEAKKALDSLYWRVDTKVFKAEKRIMAVDSRVTELLYSQNKVSLSNDEKIRVVFLFQIAPFWASMESLYEVLNDDPRFAVSIMCYDEEIDPSIKVDTAEEYLATRNIPHVRWDEVTVDSLNPHIVFLQTAYDTNRRENLKSEWLKSKGIRVVYIGYGIEFPDTEQARKDHFMDDFFNHLWRLYTFSPAILKDYLKYCSNSGMVRVLGTPRFDSLYRKERYSLASEIAKLAGGRKICLLKVHFPKTEQRDGKWVLITPALDEYIEFATKMGDYPNIFFVLMPHPKFREFNSDKILANKAKELLTAVGKLANAYIDTADDYKPTLLNADYIIVDRSAVMVEAGSTGVPVMFMSNSTNKEKMTDAVAPLIESYYQGSTCDDMVNFVKMCISGKDEGKQRRLDAWAQCIPFFDGKCSERIADDIANSIISEQNWDAQEKRDAEILNTIAAKDDAFRKVFDARIWKTEKIIVEKLTEEGIKQEELHKQIDWVQRDILIALTNKIDWSVSRGFSCLTEFPIAYTSPDHIHPVGTINDHSRHPRFIRACEQLFPNNECLSFLDLGCSGGGIVLDAVLRGHIGVGLEGSDISLIQQRAEWRLLRDNLFTCDITKPFTITRDDTTAYEFDVISAWEVLEHLTEAGASGLFSNLFRHMHAQSIFVCSISQIGGGFSDDGMPLHQTIQPLEWWERLAADHGFELLRPLPLAYADFARGNGNPSVYYKPFSSYKEKEGDCELAVFRKKQ